MNGTPKVIAGTSWPGAKRLLLAAAFVATIIDAKAQTETWISTAGGNWSLGSNWLDGSAPASNPAGVLRFSTIGGTSTDSTHDLATGFQVNRLIFEQRAGRTLFLGSLASRTLRLSGSDPRISQAGGGTVTISAPLVLGSSSGLVTIDGAGLANLTLSGSISSAVAGHTLRIAGATSVATGPLITISGSSSNTITGTIVLDSGNLALGAGALGTTTLRVNGGTVRFLSGVTGATNPIELGGDFVIVEVASFDLRGVISSAAANAGLQFRGTGTGQVLQLSAASTYTGPTRVDYNLITSTPFADGGTLRLTGNGSILNTSEVDVRAGGTLAITTLASGVTNRLGDTTPVILRGGRLSIEAASGVAAQSETVGPISVAGVGSITVGPAGRNVDLNAASLTRLQRGTVLFRSPTLGGPAATAARILFATAPAGLVGGGGAGPEVSILPYAIGDVSTVGSGTGLVTYESGVGVRLLNTATEYTSSLAAAAPTHNVRLVSSEVLAGDATINALVLTSGSSVTGSGTLTVSSGAVISTASSSSISVPLHFGAAEGQLFNLGFLTSTQPISGSGGLTKSGAGVLFMTVANSFSGPLTVNAGTISFRSMDHLGADSGTIVINGGGLRYNGSNPVSFTRPVEITNGFAFLEASPGLLAMDAPVSGAGGLRIGSQNNGTVRLNVPNTHAGPTAVSIGTLEFASDAVFGSGEVWIGSAVRLLGNWNTSRPIRILGGNLNTNGFDAEWNGVLTGSVAFAKLGAGTLTITTPSPFVGDISINGGTLALAGAGLVRSTTFNVAAAGELHLDDTASSGERLNVNAIINLSGGRLRLTGASGIPSRETLLTLNLAPGFAGNILQFSSQGAPTTLQANGLVRQGSELLVRADALGGASGSAFSRVIFTTPPVSAEGLLPGVYATAAAGATPENFTTYDTASDAAGVIGLRSLTAADYTSATLLANPSVPTTAHALIPSAATAGGSSNTVRSLAFAPGASLVQTAGQSLAVSSGQILVRSGGAAASLTGGTLAFGAQAATVTTFGDFVLDAAVSGSAGWTKSGLGKLTLGAQPAGAATLTIGAGTVSLLTPAALANQIVQMSGSAAVLDLTGLVDPSIGGLAGTGTLRLAGNTLTLGGTGQSFSFASTLEGTGEVRIVEGGNPNIVRGISTNATVGGPTFTLVSGRLTYSAGSVANPAPLTIVGGTLEGSSLRAPLHITGEARVRGSSGFSIVSPSVVTGPGTLRVEGFSQLSLQVPANHTGETILPSSSQRITLEQNGALTATSAIRLDGSELYVYYGTSAAGRLNDSATLHLRSALFSATGPTNSTVIEQTGVLFAGPDSTLDLAPESSTSTTSVIDFRPAQIVRDDFAVLEIVDRGLGQLAAARHVTIRPVLAPALVGGGAVSGPNTGIVPWMFSKTIDPSLFRSFVTYEDVGGLRTLVLASDFAQNFAGVTAPTNNLRVSGAQTLTTPLTVNSLLLSGHIAQPNLTGSGLLAVTSGAVLSDSSGDSVIGHGLDFGGAEALFMAERGRIAVSGPISGSGGMTVTGSQGVALSGTNTFTGALRVIGSFVSFQNLAALGIDSSPVELRKGNLSYGGTSDLLLSRAITIGSEGGSITNVSNTTTFSIAGLINGSGNLTYSGSGTIFVTGNNTYTGDTTVGMSLGTLKFSSDAALGQGGAVRFSAGTLEPAFDWTTTRDIYPNFNASISSGAFNVSLNGRVLGNGGLRKFGSGTLTLSDVDEFFGSLYGEQGVLAIKGPLPLGDEAFGGDDVGNRPEGTLAGSGVWERAISNSGTLAPGIGVGSLSARDVSFGFDSTLALEIFSAAEFDRLFVRGTLSITNFANLTLVLGYDPHDDVDSFLVIDNDGTEAIAGFGQRQFRYAGNDLEEGESFLVGTQEFRISYTGGDGNDIVLHATPEPGTFALLLTGLPLILSRRRNA